MRLRGAAPRRRHGIESGVAPRMAAAEAFHSEPRATKESVHLDRFRKIFRAARREPASPARASHPVEEWRERVLVDSLERSDQKFHRTNHARWNRAAQVASILRKEPGMKPWPRAPSR